MKWLQEIPLLTREFGGNSVLQWLSALAIFVALWLILITLRRLVRRRLLKVAERTALRFDDIAVGALGDMRQWFFAGVATEVATRVLTLPKAAVGAIDFLFVLVCVLQVAIFAQNATERTLSVWQEGEEGRGRRTTLARAIRLSARAIIWAIALLVMLQNLGVEITALVAGLGVGGIAVGLALQNVMADLFAALSIYSDRPFDVGDFIAIGSMLGTVEAVGWRSTRIAALGGEELIIFNGDITSSRIQNLTRMKERRVVTELRLSYDMSYAQVASVAPKVQEIIESVEGTRFDRSHFKHFGEYALLFEAVYYVLAPEYATFMDCQQQINLQIMQWLEAQGIAFAFPRRTVQLEGEHRP